MKRSRQSMTFGDTLSRIRYKSLIYIALSWTIPFCRHVEFYFRVAYGNYLIVQIAHLQRWGKNRHF